MTATPAPYITVARRCSPAARNVPAKLARNQRKKTYARPNRIPAIRIALCLSWNQVAMSAADASYFFGLPGISEPTTSRITKTMPLDAASRSGLHLPICPALLVSSYVPIASWVGRRTAPNRLQRAHGQGRRSAACRARPGADRVREDDSRPQGARGPLRGPDRAAHDRRPPDRRLGPGRLVGLAVREPLRDDGRHPDARAGP